MSSQVSLGMPALGGSVLLADPRGYCAGVDRAV
ncbi:MAG: 4-hydroxy-3-methylbut-2-enyl diphosphate reductase, partial [Aeromicrobium sp.]|nr:4-hydroxy-3-methylbut-2-enyl diphosphate reductase [Aeromicrobium sp.]